MKNRILKYFFSIGALVLFTGSISAQSQRTKGLRVGVDLSRFALYYLQPEREGYELSGDFEIKRDLYITGEYGIENINLNKSTYNYRSEGYYFRAGVDRNLLKSENPDEYEMVFFGVRYGYASQLHSAENIILQNPYWTTIPVASITEKECTTHWIELVAGIRAELFWNFSIGWSVRGKLRLAHKGYENIDPFNVPGYGNGTKKSNLGFNFSIYYRIPLYKQQVDYKSPETK
jgi:hypothetical protein